MEGKKKMLATLVGCNYAGKELRGCINDVRDMRKTLVDSFDFAPGDITVLTDEPGAAMLPTGANIMTVLSGMVKRAAPGDVLLFHYSGHRTRVPSNSGKDGHYEAIVPCDLNLITDDDFRELLKDMPEGATFTIVSDSCHSGGLIDQEKEQIGPASVDRLFTAREDVSSRSRFTPWTWLRGASRAAPSPARCRPCWRSTRRRSATGPGKTSRTSRRRLSESIRPWIWMLVFCLMQQKLYTPAR